MKWLSLVIKGILTTAFFSGIINMLFSVSDEDVRKNHDAFMKVMNSNIITIHVAVEGSPK